jgi:hypothetical protein
MKLSEFKNNSFTSSNEVEFINHLYIELRAAAELKNNDLVLRSILKRLMPIIVEWADIPNCMEDIELDEIEPYYEETWHYNRYWGCILSKAMEAYHLRNTEDFHDGIREMLTMIYVLMVTMKKEEDKIKWEELI